MKAVQSQRSQPQSMWSKLDRPMVQIIQSGTSKCSTHRAHPSMNRARAVLADMRSVEGSSGIRAQHFDAYAQLQHVRNCSVCNSRRASLLPVRFGRLTIAAPRGVQLSLVIYYVVLCPGTAADAWKLRACPLLEGSGSFLQLQSSNYAAILRSHIVLLEPRLQPILLNVTPQSVDEQSLKLSDCHCTAGSTRAGKHGLAPTDDPVCPQQYADERHTPTNSRKFASCQCIQGVDDSQ